MRVVASDEASDLIAERGGELYVWLDRSHCCGGLTTLATATERPARRRFRRVSGTDRPAVFVPEALARLPEELHVEVRRFPRRVKAYWDGCAWVV